MNGDIERIRSKLQQDVEAYKARRSRWRLRGTNYGPLVGYFKGWREAIVRREFESAAVTGILAAD